MEIKIDNDVEKFLAKLEKSTQAKALRIIELLKEFGSQLPMPYSRIIQKNIYELSIRGVQEVRLMYTIKNSTAYIVHGFVKKAQKTPLQDILIAKQRIRLLGV